MKKSIVLMLLLGWMSTAHAQGVQKEFRFNDSIEFRYGVKYAVDNLPGSLRESKEQLEAMRAIQQRVGKVQDSICIFAKKEMLQVTTVEHEVFNNQRLNQGVVSRYTSTLGDYVENGATLFRLFVDIEYDGLKGEEPTFRSMKVILENFDPSYKDFKIGNVMTHFTPFYRMKKEWMGKTVDSWMFDVVLKGDIYAERILPDGSMQIGKLYQFQFICRKEKDEITGGIYAVKFWE